MPFMPAAAPVSTTLPRPARQQHYHQQQQQQHQQLHQQQQQQLLRQQPVAQPPPNLNQALAIVANKWDREERRQEQEATRRLTVLKQRKISAILKVRMGRRRSASGGNRKPKIVIPTSPASQFICVARLWRSRIMRSMREPAGARGCTGAPLWDRFFLGPFPDKFI